MRMEFIKPAEFEIADLTILCGHNNTGKTRISQSLYLLLEHVKRLIASDKSESAIKIGTRIQLDDSFLPERSRRHVKLPTNVRQLSKSISKIRLVPSVSISLDIDNKKINLDMFNNAIIPNVTLINNNRSLITSSSDQSSLITKEYPEIMPCLESIMDGDLIYTNPICYRPNCDSRRRYYESDFPSSVRSVSKLAYYLKHIAKKGDLLFIDKPELNLHPSNQRKIARLFSRLVNIGIRVFITTHSDYIIKELNTLIMLNNEKKYIKEIAKRNGYKKEELISVDKIRVYISRKVKRRNILKPADIDPYDGIRVETFDEDINEMNDIQNDILYGDD